jgi:FixJ family two-component response regulator
MELPYTIHLIQLDAGEATLVYAFARNRGVEATLHLSVHEFLQACPGESAAVLSLGAEKCLLALELLRKHRPLIPVVVVAEAPSTELTVAAMQRGAAAVLSRPLDRAALERELDRVLQIHQEQRSIRAQREKIAARLASLNEGEHDVVARLMAGMANKNIAAELHIGLRTVELRRAKILKKLGARSLAEMVRLVLLAEPERLYGAQLTAACSAPVVYDE